MQILNWPHTLQRALAKLWLKAISSASLQNWLCCIRAALSFQHSSPYTVLNVSFKVPTRFPVNTSGDIIFQRNTLCTELQSCIHVSWDRPPSFPTALEVCHGSQQPPEQNPHTSASQALHLSVPSLRGSSTTAAGPYPSCTMRVYPEQQQEITPWKSQLIISNAVLIKALLNIHPPTRWDGCK